MPSTYGEAPTTAEAVRFDCPDWSNGNVEFLMRLHALRAGTRPASGLGRTGVPGMFGRCNGYRFAANDWS